MCGRVWQVITDADLRRWLGVTAPAGYTPSYHLAPTQPLLIVRETGGRREAALARWGLIPPDLPPEQARRLALFNARAESIHSKPSFRSAFQQRRCLVPLSGFYEWTGERVSKTPHAIQRVDGKPLMAAGLWAVARTDAGPVESCTILTTDPSPDVSALHDRMPAILLQRDWATWLSSDTSPEAAKRLLLPYPAGTLTHHAVRPLPRPTLTNPGSAALLERAG